MQSINLSLFILAIVSLKGVLLTDSRQLPAGASSIVTAPGGDATTTLYLDATRDGKYPIGILTSTVDKFIRSGTTTDYVTQEIGTHIDNKYARVTSTSSLEYYRLVQPTHVESGEIKDTAVQPTGLVLSSVSLKVGGGKTTEYTIEHFRSFVDGHYAHVLSTVSKVYPDPPKIVATPIYRPDSGSVEVGLEGQSEKKSFLFPREHIKPAKPLENDDIPTKTIGAKTFSLKSPKALQLGDLLEKESNIHDATETLENNIQVRSINPAFALDPAPVAKDPDTVPTFTVDEDGDLNIPTPSIIVLEENEIEPTSTEHRFEKPLKTTQESVTFVGFVDFTTTIDDTVVIFSPKKTFSTATRNFLVNKIQPSSVPDDGDVVVPSVLPSVEASQPETHRTSDPNEQGVPKATSGLNQLKSLFAARQRSSRFSKPGASSASEVSISASVVQPSTTLGLIPNRPKITLLPNLNKEPTEPSPLETTESVSQDIPELSSSIDLNSDVELVYKTLYTTYTYFTTYFRASSTRIKSREEVSSNVVTLTNLLDPSDLASLKSSCEVDSTCHFVSSLAPTSSIFSSGFVGRPTTKEAFPEVPRSSGNEADQVVNGDSGSVLQTFYTTYTYFTTLLVDGTQSVVTQTEVFSDIKSSGVPVSFLSQDSQKIQATVAPQAVPSPASSPKLAYSSIQRGQVGQETSAQSELPDTFDGATPLPTGEVPNDQSTDAPEESSTEALVPTSLTDLNTAPLQKDDKLSDDDEVTTESDPAIDLDPSLPAPARTFYTTYTYFTTLFKDGEMTVTSELETVTNVAQEDATPAPVQPSVTFFTTFTYWTTFINGDETVIQSSEQTKTDIVPASVTEQLDLQPSTVSQIDVTQTASFAPDADSGSLPPWTGEDTTTNVPELESGETEPSLGVQSSGSTVTPSLGTSSAVSFEHLDEAFILSSSSGASSLSDDSSSALSAVAKASRSRLSFTKQSRSLTPAIRPNLFKTRERPNLRARGSTSTTVAIITLSEVTPTLIATLAQSVSTSIEAAPSSTFKGPSRSGSRFSTSRPGSVSPSSSGIASSAISPTQVQDPNAPTILSGVSLRRPNPFQARLKERQRQQLQKLRSQSGNETDDPAPKSLPFPSSPQGENTPIFVSSKTEKITPKIKDLEKPSAVEDDLFADSTLDLPENIRNQREKARSRISKLFKSRRPQILRPRPNFEGQEEDPLEGSESRRRRKRQVSSYYSEFGARTSSSSAWRPPPQHYDHDDDQTYSYSQYQSPNPKRSTHPKDSFINNDYFYYSSDSQTPLSNTKRAPAAQSQLELANTKANPSQTQGKRQARQNSDESIASQRSRSRFNGGGRVPIRTRSNGDTPPAPPPTTTTTTTKAPLRSRFRPRTISSNSNTNNRIKSQESPANPSRFSPSSRRPATSLFDYEYEDEYDYNVELESSQNSVPDFITVTHIVPLITTVEFGNSHKDIITTAPSLEVIAATDLKSTNIDGSPVIYAKAHTSTPALGTQVVTFDALRATETTAVVFTPTRIRGLRTSFSHAVPSTIYNIRSVTTSIVDPVDQNTLLTQLLLKFLSNQPQQPQLPNLVQQNNAVPRTQYITHTSTTSTTITNVKSTVLPITLRGREIKTTLVESSTEVVTLTELSTETLVAPTPVGLGGAIFPTANPLDTLQGLLGGAGGGGDIQQQLLLAQLQQQLQGQQQPQILTQPSLNDLALSLNLNPSPVVDQGPQTPLATAEPEPPVPKTSLVTVFVSGKSPGEFTKLTSTVVIDDKETNEKKEVDETKTLKKRSPETISPSPTLAISKSVTAKVVVKSSSEPSSRSKRSPQLINANPVNNPLGTSQSSTQNLGLLLQIPDFGIDIFPRNTYSSSPNNQPLNSNNGRVTLFPFLAPTSRPCC